MKRKQHAFTLVELMVTIAVMAILLAVAMPSFTTMMANNRSSALGREFAAMVSLARAEAIRRGGRVSICVSSDGATCAAAGTNWNNGWLLFADNAGSDTATPVVGTLIKYQQGDTRSTISVMRNATAISFFRFTGQGLLARAAGSVDPITVSSQYSGCQGTNAQQIQIGVAGRMSQSKQNCN